MKAIFRAAAGKLTKFGKTGFGVPVPVNAASGTPNHDAIVAAY
jgi:hypothetical protein